MMSSKSRRISHSHQNSKTVFSELVDSDALKSVATASECVDRTVSITVSSVFSMVDFGAVAAVVSPDVETVVVSSFVSPVVAVVVALFHSC